MDDKHGGVFLLDDDVLFLKIYKELFEAKGYEIFVTDSVKQFLQAGRQKLPDIMLIDVNLPHTSGWDVLRQISQDAVLQQIPTVVLSVCQDYDLAHIKGAAHFINKPVSPEILDDILRSYYIGGLHHDLLLLEEYEPLFHTFTENITKKYGNCFITHNIFAAKRYLQKNNPKKIGVHYNRKKFAEVENEFPREKVVLIDSVNEIEEILKSIK